MLYFYLLLARLEARGEIGRPSFERRQPNTLLDSEARSNSNIGNAR
jgi:hypothetical protein